MIKCQKDPACGIFLKRGLFKDIKNYIPMCHTRKYWCWCTEGDALKVMQWRWCTEGDSLKVMYWRWCTEGDAVKVMHGRWCTEGDALKGINWGWCTEGDALKVIYWQIISRTFLAHSALVLFLLLICNAIAVETWTRNSINWTLTCILSSLMAMQTLAINI